MAEWLAGLAVIIIMDDIPWGPDHPRYFDTAEDFFGGDPTADYNRWSAVQHWTADEAVALSFGFDPRVVKASVLRNYGEHPFAAEYDRRMDLAARAEAAGQLSTLSSPRRYIKWALSTGIIFPSNLVEMVKPVAKGAKSTTSSTSGLRKLINKLSLLALGMTEFIYGFNPDYETIVADLQNAEIAVNIESVKNCLKEPDDLYFNLPEVRETLSKIVLGMAICHFDYDPKTSRSKAASKIAEALKSSGKSLTTDTIRTRLNEAASDLGMA